MSEFKNDKTSLENAKFDFCDDQHDLFEHLEKIEKEHKQMLEMLRNISDNEYVSGQTYNEIEELIKQATQPT